MEGSTITSWTVFLTNGRAQQINPLIEESTISGITGRFMDGVFNTLLITVNTTETSVTGLRCSHFFNNIAFRSTIKLTIYGKL